MENTVLNKAVLQETAGIDAARESELLRICQIVPRIAAMSSGPSQSVPALCRAMQDQGHAVRLLTLLPNPERTVFEQTQFYPAAAYPLAARLGVSKSLKQAIAEAARTHDVLHTNSLWMMPNIYPAAAVRGTDCKLVVSPRGTLSPWAKRRSAWRKRIVWALGQRQCLQQADCIHVTSEDELQYVRDLGFRNPVAVVPNGVACPEELPESLPVAGGRRKLLFLARIHPTKGVDILLAAWRVVQAEFPDWDLEIAGPTNNDFARQMMQLAATRQLERVRFAGELTGDAKRRAFQEAELYVLPSHSENFGISVAEALAHSVPAIVFHGAPWSGLNVHQAGWWVEPGFDSLVATLRTALACAPGELSERGARGYAWMRDEFDWQRIAQRMSAVYQTLHHGAPAPPELVFS
jgi:glycosyltransferase involved in cell wall biosynthesis